MAIAAAICCSEVSTLPKLVVFVEVKLVFVAELVVVLVARAGDGV
jgi:hypothetical protein